ncbi:MAG: ATP-binding cassette domain-containing protein, partial [Clostridia bacterium]|nr:ATP-binding cassette domain-containing protein [Clostridia bacterium]
MTPVVLFRGVHKVYPKGIEALKGVDLVVEEGEAVGLAGPNGAGKTTIV